MQSKQDVPLVSILTPSFNQAHWLSDNLRSVSCQSYPRIEHIVMDGGSTDGSVAVLEAAGHDVRWRSEPDAGQADAINKAFGESRGDILGWINSDDAYFDCRVVEDVVAEFRRHPEVDVLYGHCLQVDADGRAIQLMWARGFDPGLQRAVNLQSQPATFIRRTAVSPPLLDASFHFAMDYELWLRLSSLGKCFRHMNRLIAIDRHQPDRKSSTIKDVHEAELRRLDDIYELRLSDNWNRVRSEFYVRQRLMGALLIRRVRPDRLAFTAPHDIKRGLVRRQLFTRRRAWPEGYQ